ncbi:MAG: 4'-phosphopantetheinyl transferase superfamily protein [Candidatus Sulfotelmatobacter sp.]
MHKDQTTSADTWEMSPKRLQLLQNEVHVWRANLDSEAIHLRQFERTLSTDEKERANRFFFPADRNGFIVTRGILREMLGKYVNRAPGELEFDYGPNGKPSLRTDAQLQFNISHSQGIALLAFSLGRRLGVDVEFIREIAGEEISEHYFSPQEVAELRSLPPPLRDEGFFLCWTRKEAYVKARGEGLHVPLNSFRVTLTPGKPEQLRTTDGLQWSLHSLSPDAHYVGAVVGEGRGWKLRCWSWAPPDGD